MILNRMSLRQSRQSVAWLMAGALGASCFTGQAVAQADLVTAVRTEETPQALIKTVSNDMLHSLAADTSIKRGDVAGLTTLVNAKVMPHVDFRRMTASAVGRYWRQATPTQQQRLEDEFKALLIHTYSGALAQVQDQSVDIQPSRAKPTDKEVLVRTLIRGSGDPIQLDYRLERTADGWKIYDVSVLGIWLVENYRNTFSEQISANGIDALIDKMQQRNLRNKG